MGIPIGIDVRDPQPVDTEPAFAWLREVDAIFSTYREDSEISRLDRGELMLADCRPEVDEVLTRCMRARAVTGGAFSARAGRPSRSLRLRQGLGGRRRGARSSRPSASASTPAATSSRAAAHGAIGIRHPEELEQLAAVLEVEDLAVATSGEYERAPTSSTRTPAAPPTGLLSVTVVGPDLALADAYATAAFAMGADGPEWTATLNGYNALCITSDHQVLETPGFARHRAG